MEVRTTNEMYGVFEIVNEGAQLFFEQNGYCIILMNPLMRKIPAVQVYQHENRCLYGAFLIKRVSESEAFSKNFHTRFIDPLDEESMDSIMKTLEMPEKLVNMHVSLLRKVCLHTRVLERFGTFSVKKIAEEPEKIKKFFNEKNYMILDLDHENMLKSEFTRALEEDLIGIVISTKNMENFKDTFHRSAKYVSSKTLNLDLIKALTAENKHLLDFFCSLEKNHKEIQVRVIKEIRIRSKHLLPA